MLVTAWTNGKASFGVKISFHDRETYFQRQWDDIVLDLEGCIESVIVNTAKKSFWTKTCGELIHKRIGQWIRLNGLDEWGWYKPPKLILEQVTEKRFALRQIVQPAQKNHFGSDYACKQ